VSTLRSPKERLLTGGTVGWGEEGSHKHTDNARDIPTSVCVRRGGGVGGGHSSPKPFATPLTPVRVHSRTLPHHSQVPAAANECCVLYRSVRHLGERRSAWFVPAQAMSGEPEHRLTWQGLVQSQGTPSHWLGV
jgi:hypothetical protein